MCCVFLLERDRKRQNYECDVLDSLQNDVYFSTQGQKLWEKMHF